MSELSRLTWSCNWISDDGLSRPWPIYSWWSITRRRARMRWVTSFLMTMELMTHRLPSCYSHTWWSGSPHPSPLSSSWTGSSSLMWGIADSEAWGGSGQRCVHYRRHENIFREGVTEKSDICLRFLGKLWLNAKAPLKLWRVHEESLSLHFLRGGEGGLNIFVWQFIFLKGHSHKNRIFINKDFTFLNTRNKVKISF